MLTTRSLALLVPFLLLPVLAAAAPLALPVHRAGEPAPSPCYAGDVLELRLAPAAARAAHPRAADPTRPVRALRLGLSGIDAVSSLLGGCEFEPEFVGETTPDDPAETDFTQFWLVHLPPGAALEEALARFGAVAGVQAALPVATLPLAALPNDSLFVNQTWLYRNVAPRHDTRATEAWDVEDGDTSIVVAIIDTGVLPYHPDLGGTLAGGSGQMWRNWAEVAGLPGVDDDGNGFVDDFAGWDFVAKSFTTTAGGEDGLNADNDPNDFAGHGTAVAGIIGAAVDNALGMAGIAPRVRLMPLRAAWMPTGVGQPTADVSMTYAAQAIRYATRMGAQVINASFASIDSVNSGLGAAVSAATRAGIAIANASGNNFSPAYLGGRDDVVSVAATDSNDVVALFSVRAPWVDLSAQGTGIVSTFVGRAAGTDSVQSYRVPSYRANLQGTSFAAPQVAGVMALLQAQRRAQGLDPYTPQGLLARLRETADDIKPWNPVVFNYGTGRLNAYRALTDRPMTSAVRALAQTVGAPVILRNNLGVTRVVYAASGPRVLAFEGAGGDTAWVTTIASAAAASPAAADFGGGHGPLVLVPTINGSVLAIDADGNAAATSPWAAAHTVTGLGTTLTGGVAIGDVDGDGAPDVVAAGQNGRVWAWGGSPLALLPNFPFDPFAPGGSAVALADLDGFPGAEIVFVAGDGAVHAVRSDGTELDGWPYTSQPGARAPVVARFAGAGAAPTVLVAVGTSLAAIGPDGGERWNATLPLGVTGDLALGDLTGDGFDEIVVPAGTAIAVLDSSGVAVPNRAPAAQPAIPAGTFVIGPLRPGGGVGIASRLPAIAASQTPAGYYAWDDSGRVVAGFPKPAAAGVFASLADLDGDGATEIAAGAGLTDSVVYAFDAGAATWDEAHAYWPTARGDDARTGARGATIGLPLYDRVPPAAPAVIAEALSSTRVRVRWINTGDDGVTGSAARAVVVRSTVPFDGFITQTDVPFPGAPGTADTLEADAAEGQQLSFSVSLVDEAGNAGPAGVDTVLVPGAAPQSIADLVVIAAHDSTVTLRWTAPVDDGPAGRPASYELAGFPAAFDSAAAASAPVQVQLVASAAAGSPESLTVTGLARGRRWSFAARGVDATGARSPWSNVASVTLRTGGAIEGRGGVAIAARPVPGAPPITLDWQGAEFAPAASQWLDLYDLRGRRVLHVALGGEPGGSLNWDGRDAEGRSVPAGLYFARLASGGGHSEARVVLVR